MVVSGIPQWAILGLFIIFSNDFLSTCEDNVKLYLFTDDTEIYCHIKDDVERVDLHKGIICFVEWSDKWQRFDCFTCPVCHA